MYILPHIYLFSTTFIPCYNNVEENSNQQSLSRKKEKCSPMGNHKFRFSDMLPNTWFYKLRDMSKTKKPKTSASKKKNQYSSYSTTLPKPQFSQPRSSFYYAAKSIKVSETYFLDPPRKSSTKITNRKTIYKPSPKHNIPSSVSSTKDNFLELDFLKSPSSEFDSDCSDASQSFNQVPSCPNSCICQLSSSANDIIIDINGNGHTKQFKNIGAGYDTITELELPPIHTKKMAKLKENPNMNAELAIHRRAVGYNALRGTNRLKVKVLEPKTFDGTRSTNKLENFLRDMEQYFDVACVQEKEKVTTASMYLSGDAKLWWRTCMTNVKKADEPKIDTWKHMKKKLKDQFLPKTRVLGTSASRKYVNFSPSSGIKLRTNSTKIASKNRDGRGYKSMPLKRRLEPQKERYTTRSFAIVKTSIDPEKDFRESMMEMVVENNIKASKDLENLLACYLSLNSDEYHDLIIKAFQQIWFNLPEPHL